MYFRNCRTDVFNFYCRFRRFIHDSVSTSSLAEKLNSRERLLSRSVSTSNKDTECYANSISDLRLAAFFIAIVAGLCYVCNK
ncbi:MAG: hypothetical protein IPH77_11905 [Ignavibacteria bacterium]|nr:hypothetical protein [Ignavibacteria bacterium]